jgi:hyperosmotically inducible protein
MTAFRSVGLSLLAAAAQLAVAGYVHAQADAAPTNPFFLKLDTNHDRFISREEAKQDKRIDSVFGQADMNKDGKLDEDEFLKAVSISGRETVVNTVTGAETAAQQYALDLELTVKVKAALVREKGFPSTDVTVQTNKGRVMLAGFVDNQEQVALAGKLAAGENGVKTVINNLMVK